MENNELYHYGVLGMKWGVRRTKTQLGRGRSQKKKRPSEQEHEDYRKVHDRKSVKSMSDAELRSRLNRLNMEKQYKQLSSGDVNRGKKFASRVMKTATVAATVTTTGLTLYNNASKIKAIVEPMIKK